MFSFLIPWNHLSSLPALTRSFSHIPAANYIMTSQKGNWFCFLNLPPPSESSRPFWLGIWTWDSTEVAVTRLQWPSCHYLRSSIVGLRLTWHCEQQWHSWSHSALEYFFTWIPMKHIYCLLPCCLFLLSFHCFWGLHDVGVFPTPRLASLSIWAHSSVDLSSGFIKFQDNFKCY